MLPRPDALGVTISLASVDDVDAALHEMAWLTAKENGISDAARVKIAAITTDAQSKAVVTVEQKPLTIKERWNALAAAVHAWCETSLRAALPKNKRSLDLPHGAIKLRSQPAAVALKDGKTAGEVALNLAQTHGLITSIDKLMKKSIDVVGGTGQPVVSVSLNELLSVNIVLNKDAVKDLWAKRPEIHAFLQSLSISVEAGPDQITVAPASLAVMTPDPE